MKKFDRQGFLAISTFFALIVLMVIQVSWLFNAARLEEKTFNQTVAKALIEAREEIGSRVPVCNNMKNYLCGHPCQATAKKKTIAEIDSIIRSQLNNYQIELDYTFEITDSTYLRDNSKLFGSKCYLQSLNGLLEKDGIQIRLVFPARRQFLLAQMKGAFLLAMFSVLFVMVSFIITFRMFKKERQIVKQTSDFINNMVHEFQTPLSNIRLAASLIKKKESTINDEKVMEYTSVILKENLKLENHVVNILKVSCGNENECSIEHADIHQIIADTGSEFKTRLDALNGKIEYNFDAKHYTLKVAPDHFVLIFSNLIDNAIKYSSSAPLIAISTINRKNTMEITVKDNGIGIETKDLPMIFEKYYRVSTGNVHNVKGFGLGLTYVKKLVEQYKGKIEVFSSKGSGSLFTITLPLDNEENKDIIG
jgi:two-component system, OmpR family, phosphate regulon sensor histidine kinase PhoR